MSKSRTAAAEHSGPHPVELDCVKDSSITNVNLYTSLAEITRAFKFSVKEGLNQVNITGLPNTLDQNSLRVEGIHTSIQDVIISSSPENNASDVVRELTESKIKTETAIHRCQFISKSLERYLSSLNVKDVAFVDLSGTVKNYQATSEELENRIGELHHELATIDLKLADERKRDPASRAKNCVKITIGILAGSGRDAEFNIIYGVSRAHWSAFYDIRVNTRGERPAVELVYKASISQNTGEDWSDVDLTLQTAEPSFGGKIPPLRPWLIYRAIPEEDLTLRGSSFGSSFGSFSAGSFGGSISTTGKGDLTTHRAKAAETHHAPPHELPHANIIAPFVIDGKIHIPGDGATHSVTMTRLNLDSETHLVVVPKREARAHSRAKVKNTSEYPLLSGPAHVYVDESFTASMELPVVIPEEYFDCPLGHDPSIQLTYHPRTKRTSRIGFYNKSTTQTFTQHITITNNRKTSPIEGLRVFDQFPVSDDPRVAVKYICPGLSNGPKESTSGEIKAPDKVKVTTGVYAQWSGADDPDANTETLGKDGKFEWTCSIPAQSKIELRLQFEVTAPYHSQIIGL